jgi:NTE family protein
MAGVPNPTNEPDVLPPETPTPAAGGTYPQPGIGLCVSGGGYRAMLFHLGALWRLNELGLLPRLNRISSVSGGSIVAAYLGARWNELNFNIAGVSGSFVDLVVAGIRKLAGTTIDVNSIVGGLLNPFSHIADKVRAAYAAHLYGEKTLQDLPSSPAPFFVINATNVQTGALWRFSRAFMGDYHVGLVEKPTVSLALAVTASSAFPPFLSPVPLKVAAEDYAADPHADLQEPPYTTDVVLSDGGGYDNLGLETVFKRFDTVLVSDAGAKMAAEPVPHTDWARHAYRMLDIIDNQVRNLRKRILIAAYRDQSGNPTVSRKGAYWGIRTDINAYGLADAMNAQCPLDRTQALAEVPTRLEAMPDELQERLINWGYAVCDAAIRRHFPPQAAAGQPVPRPRFPYDRGV